MSSLNSEVTYPETGSETSQPSAGVQALRLKKMVIHNFGSPSGILDLENPWREPIGTNTVPPWETDSADICCC